MPSRIGKDRCSLRARSGWALLACLLAIALQPQAWADTGARLGTAQARLARIEQRGAAAQAEATRRQSDLLGVLGALSSREASFQRVQQQLMQLRAQLEA